ncbi:MAG: DUF502 domain-containing protein [Planctomycetota bacterium]
MKKVISVFRKNTLAGLLVILPLFMAFFVANLTYNWIDAPMQSAITLWLIGENRGLDGISDEQRQAFDVGKPIKVQKTFFNREGGLELSVIAQRSGDRVVWRLFPGFGIITLLLVLFFAGMLARTFFGRMFVRISEWFVTKIPGISTVYSATKQMGESLFIGDGSHFEKAVIIEYPRKGIYSIGFLTGPALSAIDALCGNDETVFVFIPTTPNPTSGWLLAVPKKECVFLDMRIEDAIKLVISGGIIVPPEMQSKIAAPMPATGATNALPTVPQPQQRTDHD